jgi:hypothetical protein
MWKHVINTFEYMFYRTLPVNANLLESEFVPLIHWYVH